MPGPASPARERRHASGAALTLAALVVCAACSGDGSPTEPPVATCGSAPTTDTPSPVAERVMIATALEDSAHRLVPALGETEPFRQVESRLTALANDIRQNRLEAACILADELWVAVAQLQVGTAGEADRDAVILALREAQALDFPRGP